MVFKWFVEHKDNLLTGALVALVGYFEPMLRVTAIVTFAILLDFAVGFSLSVFVKKQGIKAAKLWTTVYKLLAANSLIFLLYAMDKEMDILQLYKAVSWFVCGFEVWSILEKLSQISNMKLFVYLSKLMNDKIDQLYNIDLSKEHGKTDNNS